MCAVVNIFSCTKQLVKSSDQSKPLQNHKLLLIKNPSRAFYRTWACRTWLSRQNLDKVTCWDSDGAPGLKQYKVTARTRNSLPLKFALLVRADEKITISHQ